jgi:hypothetical protein
VNPAGHAAAVKASARSGHSWNKGAKNLVDQAVRA